MDNAPKEIELKLRVAPEDLAVVRNHPDFQGFRQDRVGKRQVSAYFDTDNRVLRSRGVTLRVRHIDQSRVQTVKTAAHGVGYLERSEWEHSIDSDQPDLTLVQDTALGPILTHDLSESLKPVFETDIERTTFHLNGGDTAIVMVLDEGRIVADDLTLAVSEIELELKKGDPSELFKVARTISSLVPAQLEMKSKSERGYELAAKASVAAESVNEVRLETGMTTKVAFRTICRDCLRQLAASGAMVRPRDPVPLHEMRVAHRKLRTAMSLFSGLVADDRLPFIKSELKWLGQELGPARDLDTLREEVLKPLQKSQMVEPGLASLSKLFSRERLKCYRRAQEAIASDRFRTLVFDTVEWIEAGAWSVPRDATAQALLDMPIELHAALELSRCRKRIRRRSPDIDIGEPAAVHKLRIQAKKMRYAVEFFAGIFDGGKNEKRRKKILSSLKQLQNCLGGFNDVAIRKAMCTSIMNRLARGSGPEKANEHSFAAGVIVGGQDARIPQLVLGARKAFVRLNDAKPFWK